MPPSHLKGLRSELNVALELSQKRGWILKAHRHKTRFSEIDLIFEESTSLGPFLHLVEVKSCNQIAWQEHRLTEKQLTRLIRARLFIENSMRAKVCLHLAVVSQDGEVRLIEDIGS